MSANTTVGWIASKFTLASLKWLAKKLAGFLVIYVAVGSIFQSIQAGSNVAIVLYALLAVFGVYLFVKW